MTKKIGITPLGDRVLIRPFTEEELAPKSALGIILPENTKKVETGRGEVLAVGAGTLLESGERAPMSVAVGDSVVYSKYSFDTVDVDGETYHLVAETNILAITN